MRTLVFLPALLLHLACLAQLPEHRSAAEQMDGQKRIQTLPKGQNAFEVGEFLKYKIRYGLLQAGEAELRVSRKVERSGRTLLHMVGTGRTVGMVDVFFPTRDRYDTYMDASALRPVEFIRDVDEGGYIIKRHIHFDPEAGTARDDLDGRDTVYQLPERVQDMLSAFYYARTVDARDLKVGDMIPIDIFIDHEVFHFHLQFLGRENVRTRFGKLRCLKLMPVVQSGRVFNKEEGMTLWVSDDQNKIPVKLKADLRVGSVKIELNDYRKLAHPVRFR